MPRIVNDEALDLLFRSARDCRHWRGEPVSDTILHALWELAALGPTNDHAGVRIVFIRSDAAKAQLAPALPEADRASLTAAPVAAVIAGPANAAAGSAALRDAAMQTAYLIIAARALGLDCVPVWDFDAPQIGRALFPDDAPAANFFCALGYGDEISAAAAAPRARFDEACAIL